MVRKQQSPPPNVVYQPSAKRIAQALNPATSSDTLRLWGERSFLGVQRYVAQNPNTPAAILWSLAPLYPAEVLANPVFPLLLLEGTCYTACERGSVPRAGRC